MIFAGTLGLTGPTWRTEVPRKYQRRCGAPWTGNPIELRAHLGLPRSTERSHVHPELVHVRRLPIRSRRRPIVSRCRRSSVIALPISGSVAAIGDQSSSLACRPSLLPPRSRAPVGGPVRRGIPSGPRSGRSPRSCGAIVTAGDWNPDHWPLVPLREGLARVAISLDRRISHSDCVAICKLVTRSLPQLRCQHARRGGDFDLETAPREVDHAPARDLRLVRLIHVRPSSPVSRRPNPGRRGFGSRRYSQGITTEDAARSATHWAFSTESCIASVCTAPTRTSVRAIVLFSRGTTSSRVCPSRVRC